MNNFTVRLRRGFCGISPAMQMTLSWLPEWVSPKAIPWNTNLLWSTPGTIAVEKGLSGGRERSEEEGRDNRES